MVMKEPKTFTFGGITFVARVLIEDEGVLKVLYLEDVTVGQANVIVDVLNTDNDAYHAEIGQVEGTGIDHKCNTITLFKCSHDEYCPHC